MLPRTQRHVRQGQCLQDYRRASSLAHDKLLLLNCKDVITDMLVDTALLWSIEALQRWQCLQMLEAASNIKTLAEAEGEGHSRAWLAAAITMLCTHV